MDDLKTALQKITLKAYGATASDISQLHQELTKAEKCVAHANASPKDYYKILREQFSLCSHGSRVDNACRTVPDVQSGRYQESIQSTNAQTSSRQGIYISAADESTIARRKHLSRAVSKHSSSSSMKRIRLCRTRALGAYMTTNVFDSLGDLHRTKQGVRRWSRLLQ